MLDGSMDPSVLCALSGRLPGGNAGTLGSFTPSEPRPGAAALARAGPPAEPNGRTIRAVPDVHDPPADSDLADLTFLFSDIEGSTRLWETEAGRMRVALDATTGSRATPWSRTAAGSSRPPATAPMPRSNGRWTR